MKKWIGIGLAILLICGMAFAQEMMNVVQYKISVNPYTEVTQDLTDVRAIEIYNAGKNIRVGFNSVTTDDGDLYWVIPSSAVGYERDGLAMQWLTLRLKGDTADDTAVVRVNVYKK